jgi:hypothetical protein
MNYIQTCYTSTNASQEWQFQDVWVQELLYPWYESTRGSTKFEYAYTQGLSEGWISLTEPIAQ